MKKILTLIVACFLMVGFTTSIEAKTTKKKSSSSSSSAPTRYFSDGYPNVTGHTYSGIIQDTGGKMTISFGSNGYVTVKGTLGKESGSTKLYWNYDGDGLVVLFDDYSNAIYFEIDEDGKAIYPTNTYEVGYDSPLKLIK